MSESVPLLEQTLDTVNLKTLPRLAVLAGPAGIGKTRFCLENFVSLLQDHPDPFALDILYLLPTAEHRERMVDLALRKEASGFFGERITTLNRLMRSFLKGGDFALATNAERKFLLEEIIAEKAGNYFSSVLGSSGFLEKISDLIGELKESMISPKDFRQKVKDLQKLRPEMKEKYEGLLRMDEAYESKLESLGIRDHRDGLFLLKAGVHGHASSSAAEPRAPLHPSFRHLFIDGFFDFTPLQLEFVAWLAEGSERITLTMTSDLSLERKNLFKIPLETLNDLEKLGFQTVDLLSSKNHRVLSGGTHGSAPLQEPNALAWVESHLFRSSMVGATPGDCSPVEGRVRGPAPMDSLLILEATGVRGEVEMIAREIRHLIRVGTRCHAPLHFSDIAIILRRIGDYEGVLRAVFRDFKIPVEIHERERLRDAPLARTFASFFKILLDDWKREDLFNFLKSGYAIPTSPQGLMDFAAAQKDYAEICSLELRGLDLGIVSGRERWLKEIGSPLFDTINAFHEKFQGEPTINEWIRLAEEAIQSFGFSRIPEVYEEKSRRDFAALKRLRSLLEEIRRSSLSRGKERKTFQVFARELLGLIEVDLFSLHDRDKNCVQVYDVSLARQKEYRVVFLGGLLEKYFPAEIREDPILSDEERRVVGLGERLPRQALERYFFYLGLTRAKEKVILSYPRFDLEGREALPSFYVEEVERLFSEPLPKRSYPVSQSLPRLEDVVEEREIEAHLVQRLFERRGAQDRKHRLLTLTLYNRLLEKPSFQALFPKLLFDPAAQIQDEKVRAAFLPQDSVFKPTGLETYGRCSYRYFASQVLHLEEREEGIDAAEVGTILHGVLEAYWRERVEHQKKDLEALTPAKNFVKEKLHELLKKSPLAGERRYRIELKIVQMEEWLSRMVEKEITDGSPLEPLRPRYLEFEFGFPKKGAASFLKLYDPMREDLKLRGKIDRIDIDPSGRYGLVIDYKTGGSFQRKDLDFGKALQLPLYLMAIQQLLKLKPLGGVIYQIRSAKHSGFFFREALEETGAQVNSRSLLGRKEFEEILKRAVRFSYQFAEGIKRAEIPVRPRDCDDFCPYSSVCRIEKWRLPFIYQEIREEDQKNEII